MTGTEPSAHRTSASGPWSLRLRILMAVLAWTVLGIAGIWYSARHVFDDHIEASYHEELEVHIKELAGLVTVRPDGSLTMDRPLSDPRYLVPLSGFYWQVSLAGRKPLRSPSMTRGKLDESVAHDSSVHHHVLTGPTGPTITYGMLRQAPGGGMIHFVIATDQRLLDETIAGFTRELTIWLVLLTMALLATGLIAVSFGLRPLDRLARATARLRRGEAERLEGDYPGEIAPLVSDLNAFIDHNSRIVERARVEAGNLAHALRTPLAIITDEAERLAQVPQTGSSAKVLLDQGQAMVEQIEYQLARARSAAGTRNPGTVSRITEVLPPIISAMRRLHPDRHFTLDIAGDVRDRALPVDPIDISELASIVIDNAGKWAREEVQVSARAEDGRLLLSVIDDGPGIPPSDIERAFDLGTRFDPDVPGNGLGLAIARDIATGYEIDLRLGPRADQKPGLAAMISLPMVVTERN